MLEDARSVVKVNTSYALFPLDFALHDSRNETPRANNLVAKKAVLQKIIPDLQNSEAVKRAEAETVRDFTRCSIEKVVSREASYQYIDNDVGVIVVAKEYERRYNMYLDMARRERARKQASPVQDPSSVCSSPKRGMHSRSPSNVATLIANKENVDRNSCVDAYAGTSAVKSKQSAAGGLLQSALWANLNSFSSIDNATSSRVNPHEEGQCASLAPNPLIGTFSSPAKETEVVESVHSAEQSDCFDDEDTVDFNSLKLVDNTVESASARNECPSPVVRTMTIDERMSLERKARERLLVRIEQAHAKYRWELLSLDVLMHRQEQEDE